MFTKNPFVSLGELLIQFPKASLALILAVFLALTTQLAHIRIDTSAESFLRDSDPAILGYDQFRKQFGRDEYFIVAISGEDVFTLEFLSLLRDIHHTLELKVNNLQSVESLMNVRSIYGEEDDLIAEELLEEFPETEADVALIKQRIQAKPVYYDRLINRDEDSVTILVKLIPFVATEQEDGIYTYDNMDDTDIHRCYEEINAVIAPFQEKFNGKIVVGGTQAMGAYMSTVLQHDFGVFTSVAIIMVAFFLWVLFRRLSGVLIPLCVMAVGVTSCISMMPALGYPMQITTSILPSFLLAVCVGAAVHLLSIFYHQFDQGMSKHEALLEAMNHTGTAVLFTSLTTAAGLLTFSVSEILPIASLGLFAAIGSILAFLTTLTMVPVLIVLCPIKTKHQALEPDEMKEGGLLYRFTEFCFNLSTTHPKKIVAIALTLLIAGFFTAPNIRFSQDAMQWFPDDSKVKLAIELVEEKITGSMQVEVVIDTGKAQGVLEPEFLHRLDAWLDEVAVSNFNNIPVVSINSLTTLIKETNQAFNGNTAEAYSIPNDKELVAQELLLIEMDQADDLAEFIDANKQKTRLTLVLPWQDAIVFADFQDQLLASYNKAFEQDYPIQITGVVPIFAKMFKAMITSAAQSYLIAAIAISIMMILLLRSLVDGLLSMIPNLLPIVLVLSYMVIVDLPLDVFTVLIGSIALGLCVDDTVHFMHGFKRSYAKTNDAYLAIKATLFSTGKALMITTVVLFFGFMTYTLSDLKNMDTFGLLTASCIILALLADFIVAPALMMLRYKGKRPV
jgi:hydrophobe/amphiphile efflux-3 (HAE3) family protein